MKRFHIHVGVKNLEQSVQFYSTLFGQKPGKRAAQWLTLNFSKESLRKTTQTAACLMTLNKAAADWIGP